MTHSTNNKRFEFPTPEVECNECERYWINQCEGAKLGSIRACKEYIATNNVSIPLEIKKIQRDITLLYRWVFVIGIVTLILIMRLYA